MSKGLLGVKKTLAIDFSWTLRATPLHSYVQHFHVPLFTIWRTITENSHYFVYSPFSFRIASRSMSSVRNHAMLLVASTFSSYFLGSPLSQFIAKACSSIHCLVADGEFLVTKKTIFFLC